MMSIIILIIITVINLKISVKDNRLLDRIRDEVYNKCINNLKNEYHLFIRNECKDDIIDVYLKYYHIQDDYYDRCSYIPFTNLSMLISLLNNKIKDEYEQILKDNFQIIRLLHEKDLVSYSDKVISNPRKKQIKLSKDVIKKIEKELELPIEVLNLFNYNSIDTTVYPPKENNDYTLKKVRKK